MALVSRYISFLLMYPSWSMSYRLKIQFSFSVSRTIFQSPGRGGMQIDEAYRFCEKRTKRFRNHANTHILVMDSGNSSSSGVLLITLLFKYLINIWRKIRIEVGRRARENTSGLCLPFVRNRPFWWRVPGHQYLMCANIIVMGITHTYTLSLCKVSPNGFPISLGTARCCAVGL